MLSVHVDDAVSMMGLIKKEHVRRALRLKNLEPEWGVQLARDARQKTMRLRVFIWMIDELLSSLETPRLVRNLAVWRINDRALTRGDCECCRMVFDVPGGRARIRGSPISLHIRLTFGASERPGCGPALWSAGLWGTCSALRRGPAPLLSQGDHRH